MPDSKPANTPKEETKPKEDPKKKGVSFDQSLPAVDRRGKVRLG